MLWLDLAQDLKCSQVVATTYLIVTMFKRKGAPKATSAKLPKVNQAMEIIEESAYSSHVLAVHEKLKANPQLSVIALHPIKSHEKMTSERDAVQDEGEETLHPQQNKFMLLPKTMLRSLLMACIDGRDLGQEQESKFDAAGLKDKIYGISKKQTLLPMLCVGLNVSPHCAVPSKRVAALTSWCVTRHNEAGKYLLASVWRDGELVWSEWGVYSLGAADVEGCVTEIRHCNGETAKFPAHWKVNPQSVPWVLEENFSWNKAVLSDGSATKLAIAQLFADQSKITPLQWEQVPLTGHDPRQNGQNPSASASETLVTATPKAAAKAAASGSQMQGKKPVPPPGSGSALDK